MLLAFWRWLLNLFSKSPVPVPAPKGTAVMKMYLQNKSTVVTDAEVQSWLPALQTYASGVADRWGLKRPTLVFGAPPSENTWQVILFDTSDEAGALGYHDYTPGGQPISKIFAKDDLKYGYSITVTLCHEIAEMLVDAYIVTAWQTDAVKLYALEVGDPVEADDLGYKLKGSNGVTIQVSDYALPGWFIPGHPGPYDRMGHCTKPLQVLAGGYAQYFQAGSWHQVNAQGLTGKPGDRADRFPRKPRSARAS